MKRKQRLKALNEAFSSMVSRGQEGAKAIQECAPEEELQFAVMEIEAAKALAELAIAIHRTTPVKPGLSTLQDLGFGPIPSQEYMDRLWDTTGLSCREANETVNAPQVQVHAVQVAPDGTMTTLDGAPVPTKVEEVIRRIVEQERDKDQAEKREAAAKVVDQFGPFSAGELAALHTAHGITRDPRVPSGTLKIKTQVPASIPGIAADQEMVEYMQRHNLNFATLSPRGWGFKALGMGADAQVLFSQPDEGGGYSTLVGCVMAASEATNNQGRCLALSMPGLALDFLDCHNRRHNRLYFQHADAPLWGWRYETNGKQGAELAVLWVHTNEPIFPTIREAVQHCMDTQRVKDAVQ